MVTYNQIIKANRDFVKNHLILKSFGNGEKWQHAKHKQQKSYKYPTLFLEDVPSTGSKGEFIYQFKAWFFQRVPPLKEVSNEQDEIHRHLNEAKSNMIACAQDLISYWAMQTTYDTVEVDKNFSLDTFIYEGDDWTTGCHIDLKLSETFDYDICILPSTDAQNFND